MKKNFITLIIFSMIIFSGCGTTSDDSNTTASTCNGDLSMLSGDKPVITLEGDTEIEIS
jgi:peptidoglycan hydrolase CwlO-like protein